MFYTDWSEKPTIFHISMLFPAKACPSAVVLCVRFAGLPHVRPPCFRLAGHGVGDLPSPRIAADRFVSTGVHAMESASGVESAPKLEGAAETVL